MNNKNYPGCIEAIRQARAKKNLYVDSSFEVLLSQLSELTIKQHDKNLSEWWNYCNSKNIDPLNTEISVVLDYLGKKLYIDGVSPEDVKQICPSIYLIATDELLEKVYVSSLLCCTFNKELVSGEDMNDKQNNPAGQENFDSLIDKRKKQYLSKIFMSRENNYSKEIIVNNKLPVLMKNNNFIKPSYSQMTANEQIKILVLISDNEFKVLLFNVAKKQKFSIHEALRQAGIPVNKQTKILFLTNSKLNYNFIVDCCAGTVNSIKTNNVVSQPSNKSVETSSINPSTNLFAINNTSTLDNNSTEKKNTIFHPSNNSTKSNDTISKSSSINSTERNNPSTLANNSIETNNTAGANDTTFKPSNNSTVTNDNPSSTPIETPNTPTLANNLNETNNTLKVDNKSTEKSNTILNQPNASITSPPRTSPTNNSEIYKLPLKIIVDREKSIIKQQVKILIITPNCKQKLITFNLPRKKYSVNDLLTQGGIMIDDDTAVSFVNHPPLINLNYIVECDSANLAVESIDVSGLINKSSSELLVDSTVFEYPCKIITDLKATLIEPKIKILIMMPNDQKKLIIFDLPIKKSCINDLLIKAGIPLSNHTKVSIIEDHPGLNVYYIVRYKSNELVKSEKSIIDPPLEQNTTDTTNHTQANNITTNAILIPFHSSDPQYIELIDQIHNNNILNIDNQIVNDTNENNLKRQCKEELILNQTKKQKFSNSTELNCSDPVVDESSTETQLVDRFLVELECFSMKIGSYDCVPSDSIIIIDLNGLSLRLPRQDDEQVFVDINISYYEIHEVEIHSKHKMPILFIYINQEAALRIKNSLHIQDKSLPIDSQLNTCRAQRRITLLLQLINDELIMKLENLFSPVCPYKVY